MKTLIYEFVKPQKYENTEIPPIVKIEVEDVWYEIVMRMRVEECSVYRQERRVHGMVNRLPNCFWDIDGRRAQRQQEQEDKLYSAIATLSKRQRIIVKWVCLKGKTQEYVAGKLKVTQPAIAQNLETIYKKLRKNFK